MSFNIDSSLLKAMVLSIISIDDIHGYELMRKINDVVEISDSTLYPTLKRLQKTGFLKSYQEVYNGRNRRYYSITEKGRQQLKIYMEEESTYKTVINDILEII